MSSSLLYTNYSLSVFSCSFLFFSSAATVFLFLNNSKYFQFIAYLIVSFFIVKLVSYDQDIRRGRDTRKGLLDFINFVLFWPGAIFSESLKKRSSTLPQGYYTRLLLHGLIKIGIGTGALALYAFRIVPEDSYFLSCLSKALFYSMVIDGLNNFSDCNLSLRGFETNKIFGRYYLASSPMEFWREWNAAAARWFDLYVARPISRRFGTLAGVMLTFGISGLLHEYVWGVHGNNSVILRILRMKIGQRWPEDEMRKCEVIFAQALR